MVATTEKTTEVKFFLSDLSFIQVASGREKKSGELFRDKSIHLSHLCIESIQWIILHYKVFNVETVTCLDLIRIRLFEPACIILRISSVGYSRFLLCPAYQIKDFVIVILC